MRKPAAATAKAAKAKKKKAKAKAAKAHAAHTPAHPGHHHHHPAHHPAHHPSASSAAAKRKQAAKRAAATKAHKRRGLAASGEVACCAAESVAASLRLAGGAVSDADVLALHWAAGGDDDMGAPVLAVLQAAAEHGVAGLRPVTFGPVDLDDPAAVILGLALPGPHAVTADGDNWWSWGELWPAWAFPGAVIEEAWSVIWS